jgi:hypothetical protein
MKKLTVLIISLFLGLFTFAQQNIIKFNPFDWVYGKYNLQYERMLTDYTSASASCSYLNISIPGLDLFRDALSDFGIETSSFSGATVELDYRLYSKNKSGPQGFYIGPYIRYTGLGMTTKIEDVTLPADAKLDYIKAGFGFTRIGAGVKLGAQWLLWDCVTIDWNFFGLGVDYYALKVFSEGSVTENGKTYSDQKEDYTGLFLPAINTDFSIGYAF